MSCLDPQLVQPRDQAVIGREAFRRLRALQSEVGGPHQDHRDRAINAARLDPVDQIDRPSRRKQRPGH